MTLERIVRRHHISFSHAFSGIWHSVSAHPNIRIHLFAALITNIAASLCQFSRSEWAILWLTIALVLVAEMLNTSVESIVDLITREYRQEAKIAKDVAAGMVLTAAVISIIIGCILFIPHIRNSLLAIG